jgi:hypothetical protein
LVFTGKVYGADFGALVAVDAELGVDMSGPVVDFDGKVAGKPSSPDYGAAGHDLYVGMEAVVEKEG